MQVLVTVTSTRQIENIGILPGGIISGIVVSNRNLEDFSIDMTGQQALDLLESEALTKFRETHANDVAVFVEGRVGILTGEKKGGSAQDYIQKLREAGAIGAIAGAGLVADETRKLLL